MYLMFAKKGFQQQFIYRSNTVIKIVSSFIFLFITISVWNTLYSGKSEVSGVSLREMLTYVILVQILDSVVMLKVSSYIASRCSSGIISIDLIRPVNLKLCAIANALGNTLFQLVVFTLPVVILGSVFWGFTFPSDILQICFFILSVFLAMMLYATLEYIMGLTSFWTKTDFYIQWIIGAFLIQCSLFMFANVPCFWMVKVDSLQNLKGNLSDFIQYPISIYQRWIQILLIFVFPVAFISFFPVQTFLHKTDFVGLSPIVCYLSPLVGALLFFLGYRFFLFGIKNYKSTGS